MRKRNSPRQVRFRQELKRLLRRGMPAAKAMKTAWSRVPKNPRKRTISRPIGLAWGPPYHCCGRSWKTAKALVQHRTWDHPRMAAAGENPRKQHCKLCGRPTIFSSRICSSCKRGNPHRHRNRRESWDGETRCKACGARKTRDGWTLCTRCRAPYLRKNPAPTVRCYKCGKKFRGWGWYCPKCRAAAGKNPLTRSKAREILHHGHAQGYELTPGQRRLLGAVASGYRLRDYQNPPPIKLLANGRLVGLIGFRPTRGRKVARNPSIDIRL